MTQSVWRVATPTPIPERPDFDGILDQGVDVLPVRITIVQDDVLTGWDDGALGFEENAIWFSGRATSFYLSPADLLPDLETPFASRTPFERPVPTIHLRHPNRRIKIRLGALRPDGSESLEGEAHIEREIARLRGAAGAFVSEYPPLSPRPGMVSPRGIRLAPVYRFALAGAFFLAVILAHNLATFLVLSTLAVLSGAWGLGDSDQPTLRRIAREETIGAQTTGSFKGGG